MRVRWLYAHHEINASELRHASIHCLLQALGLPHIYRADTNNSRSLPCRGDALRHVFRLLYIATDDAGIGAEVDCALNNI